MQSLRKYYTIKIYNMETGRKERIMNIQYNDAKRIFKLDTEHTSYVIAVVDEEGFPGHVYYGSYIPDIDVSYRLRTGEAPYVPGENARERSSFLDSFPSEYPGNNVGDYRESAVEIVDGNGNRGVHFLYEGHKIYNGKPGLPGLPVTFGDTQECMTLELYLQDKVVGLKATLYYSIFADCDVITRSVRIRNESDQKVLLTKVMSVSLDMDDEDYQMLTLCGAWGRERHMEYRTIGHGKQSVGSVRGESSHQEHPFVALVERGTTQERGRVYGFHFVYSGNFLAQVEKNQFDYLRVSMGIHPQNFSWQLAPGDEFTAPEVVMVYSGEGLGTMSRTYHDLYRNHLIRSPYQNRKRPILINNWEATYFDFDTDKLLAIAREAKKAGIEMLVMDDGWFGERNDDATSLGDWQVNEKKLKGGLKHLVEEVNGLGMKFGIWFEPEMISPQSRLYEEHPDWAIALPGREPCRIRNQYVLDLSRPEVADYAYSCVADILHSANIEYLKWDMNRQLTDLGSLGLAPERQGELMHRYVLALYEMQERLVQEFPDLLLENCSGGGARFDPGMLYYSPQIWCSDDTDAVERLLIQEGTALVYPLSAMGAHVSDCPNHAVGRMTPFATRGHVALAGSFGYELDVTRISEEDKSQIPEQVALYHKYNDLIRGGDYYRIASYRENHQYDAVEVVAKDRSEALVIYVQVLARPNYHSRCLRIPGLEPGRQYRLEDGDEVYYGETLAHAGIMIPEILGDFRSVLIHLVAV